VAESLDFYVNVLSGSSSGLAAVSALQSLDSAAAKATSGIQSLEGQVASAMAKLEAIEGATDAVDSLSAQLAVAKGYLADINSGKVPFDPKDYKRASDEVGKLGSQLDAAKTKQAAAIDAQKSKLAGLTGKLKEQQGAQAATANLNAAKRAQAVKGLDEQVGKLGSLMSKAQEAGGPVGALAGKLQGLAKGGVVGVVVALAVALAAVAVAGVVAAVALARYALVASDAARSSSLLSAAAAGSGSAGWELDAVVDQLSGKLPQLKAKTSEWARELALAGIAGRDMQRTLTTMGLVASAVGDQGAGKIKGIAEASRMAQRLMLGARDRFGEFASLAGTGVKAADIYAAVAKSMKTSIPEAKRMVDAGIVPFKRGLEALEQAAETRFGPIVARQMMSLDTQIAKLKENVARLFSGANIETFLAALKTVTDLFDTNTVTGFVLKEVFTEVFTSLANVAAKVMPYVKTMIMGAAFAVIMFATYAKRLAKGFQETFGGSLGGIDKMKAAFIVGAALVGGVVGGILGLAAAFVLLGAVAVVATMPIWLPFALGALVIYGTVKAITAVIDKLKSIGTELASIDLGKAAENIMNSLINGIKAKIADVKAVITDVGAAITGAFDSEMKIASPSKVMTQRANWVVDPLVTVPEQRAGEVRQAIGGLGGLDAPQRASGTGGAGGPVNITINVTGRDDGDEVARKVDEKLRAFFLGEARGSAMVPA
jgi:hypothetical protein